MGTDNLMFEMVKDALSIAVESDKSEMSLTRDGQVCFKRQKLGSKCAQQPIEPDALKTFLYGVRDTTYTLLTDLGEDPDHIDD